MKEKNPFLNQVGGNHYVKMNQPPIELCTTIAHKFNFAAGCMFKYLCRYPHKNNAAQDIRKARHYFELFLETPLAPHSEHLEHVVISAIQEFIRYNELEGTQQADLLWLGFLALQSRDPKLFFEFTRWANDEVVCGEEAIRHS